MKVSVNTIKQYIDFELPPIDELVARINSQLGATEEVIDLSTKYKGIIISKVVSCDPHEDSDHLNVCLIDDGGKQQNVERNENGYVQVVCGAANVRGGIFVAWLPPGSTVPESFDKDPFVLGSRMLRGVMSNGMLASARELSIGDDHDGIVEIQPNDLPAGAAELQPGADFAGVFGMNDTIIDIENKMFTHRPDLFGQIGVAREIAGIYGEQFDYLLDWYWRFPEFADAAGLELSVFNKAESVVPRFMVVALDGVVIGQSPLWLRCELVRLGGKPINNVVDITNYIMLLTAQPTHAYDYDKIRGNTIGARFAVEGESVSLLNGKTYDLTVDDIVIADSEGPIGLAGIMGGASSEVSAETKRIIIEAANFDMYAVRRSSMRHGLFTDAVTRFNKGQSPLQNDRIIKRLINDFASTMGTQQSSAVFDLQTERTKEMISQISVHKQLKVSADFINKRLGLSLEGDAIEQLLRNVNFACYVDADSGDTDITIAPPFWRTDIELPEDIVEEVGRLYGFDKLPLELPKRSITPTKKDALIELKNSVRSQLAKFGANEVLTYSFVHGKMLENAGQDTSLAYEISNAISPDLQYYRLSLTPSLLDKVHQNVKAGYDEFALFEIGKTHFLNEMDAADITVPNEDSHVAFILTRADKLHATKTAFFDARLYIEQIMNTDGLEIVRLTDFDLNNDKWGAQLVAPYEPTRSALIVKNEQIWGVVGEFKASVRRFFKLPKFTAGFEINFGVINNNKLNYVSLPKFPKVSQDITLQVPEALSYGTVDTFVRTQISEIAPENTHHTVELLDIYQAENSSTKNITFRFTISHFDKTMTDKEVNALLEKVVSNAGQINAVRV